MDAKELYELKIDKEFRRLVMPMSADAYDCLEKDLLEHGCEYPILCWNGIIIADYETYELCHKHGVLFCTVCVPANSREEVITRLCRKQMKRSDLTEQIKKYLIGKMSAAEQIINTHSAVQEKSRYECSATSIRERIARDYNIFHITVRNYERYASAIDILYETDSEFAEKILLGKIIIPQKKLIELACMPCVNKNLTEFLLNKDTDIYSVLPARNFAVTREIENLWLIKEMPKYDPDAEISSLALTIPSWVSSIKRVKMVADFSCVSLEAENKLLNELNMLGSVVEEMIRIIKGVQ